VGEVGRGLFNQTPMKKIIATHKAPQASNAYSQAVQAGNMLFVSGQLPIDAESGEMPETFLEQVQQVLKNLQTIVEEAQFSMSDVVKTTIFISDFYGFELREDYDRVYQPLLGEYQDPLCDDDEDCDCDCDENCSCHCECNCGEDCDENCTCECHCECNCDENCTCECHCIEEDEFDEDFFDEDECFIDNFAVLNTIYSQYFPENPPTRSCVAVKQLPKMAMIEIEAVAVK